MSSDGPDREPTRRQLLQRGAVAGGTLLWATPLVQSLDLRAAAAAAGTKPPPPTSTTEEPPIETTTTDDDDRPPFPPQGQAISHLDLLLIWKGRRDGDGDGGGGGDDNSSQTTRKGGGGDGDGGGGDGDGDGQTVYGVLFEPFGDGGAFVKHPDSFRGKSEHCMPDTGWVPAPSGLIEALNVRALVRTAGSGEQRQYVVFLPSDITFVAGWSKCGQRCAPPVPWRGGYVFNPCPPGTEIQGAVAGTPTTTTPSPPTTTTSTSTSTPAP